MDPLLLSALILGAIAVIIAVGFIVHSVEARKKLKRKMLTELYINVQEADDFLFKIPSCYLPGEIRSFLIEFLQTQYRSILALDPRSLPLKQSIETLDQLQHQTYIHNPDPMKPTFEDVVTARNTSELVKGMTNFLVRLHQQGILEAGEAKKLVGKSKIMYLLAKTETDMVAAKHIAKQGKPKVALVRYQECEERLKIFAIKNQLPNRRQQLQEQMSAISEQIQSTKNLTQEGSASDNPSEWDNLSDDDWKKKHSYD